jgi:hypothetical protein
MKYYSMPKFNKEAYFHVFDKINKDPE